MYFRIVGEIRNSETIATGRGVRTRQRPKKQYGGNRWRKLKGFAQIELENGTVAEAEIHWYECHGVGKREFKIKTIIG